MPSNWVDFPAVKQAVSMLMVLDHYQVKGLKAQGHELYGRCPIHKGEGSDAFRVSVQKNAFNCFSCHARGNVLDFVAAMEKCTVRDAALKLQEWFSVAAPEGSGAYEVLRRAAKKAADVYTKRGKPIPAHVRSALAPGKHI
jgi:DNA primase